MKLVDKTSKVFFPCGEGAGYAGGINVCGC